MSNMLHILGTALAQEIGKDELLCRGVLRMTVISSVESLQQITDLPQAMIETKIYLAKMTYQDWKAILEGPALARNLAKLGFRDTSTLSARLMQTLVEQQSLFTMTAR